MIVCSKKLELGHDRVARPMYAVASRFVAERQYSFWLVAIAGGFPSIGPFALRSFWKCLPQGC
jgi:hypothetical protein